MKNKASFLVFLFVFTMMITGAQQLKVITYNVEFAKNTTPTEMADYLKGENADIICFNEVPAQGWTKKVGELLGLEYSFEGTIASAHHTEGFNDKTKKYYGKYKSVLSKFPIIDTKEITIQGSGWSPATAVVVTIKINKKNTVEVFSLHIPSGASKANNSRAFHLSKIIKKEYSTTKRMIICGDFNDVYDSKQMQYLYDIGLQNSWKNLSIDLSEKTTYPGSKQGYVIDHILFKGLKVKSAGILKEKPKPLSDHSAVWSVFRL